MNEAMEGLKEDGIPIGAILVKDIKIIGRGHNRRIQRDDPIMHGEIDCIRDATKKEMNLRGSVLYTTHMPCYLCTGAIIQFGISRVVAGDSTTFPHARPLLIKKGIEVIDLKMKDCKHMLEDFIQHHPQYWKKTAKKNTPLVVNKYAQ